ncbi:DBIRD complex subunit ZNF326-like [Discoglossus pictus]
MASGPMYGMRSLGSRPTPSNSLTLDYGNGAYNPRPAESLGGPPYARESHALESKYSRFGPNESYDSRSSLNERDLYRSSYGYSEPEPRHFRDSFDDRYEHSFRNSLVSFEGRMKGGSSWEDASYPRPKLRTDFMDGRGGDDYSSFGGFPSPYAKPASVGSWGRGMPAFPGGRSNAAFGGPSQGRGRDRGQRNGTRWGPPGVARGTKRKMVKEPPKLLGGLVAKKQKLMKPAGNQAAKKTPPPAKDEAEEERRTEARREQQRRRREKYIEKYGDGYWMAFTCSFCKFRSFDEKGIEKHLESESHQEMLDHIQKQTKFDKPVMEFLHESIVNKYKKTAARKAQSTQNEAARQLEKDILEGVTADDHMMKVETVHCSACNVYVPALHISVQLHLKSPEHLKSKGAYKEQIKRESILTATSILNNPVVKSRYELYLKGENPFETPEVETKVGDAAEDEEEEREEEEAAQAAETSEEPEEDFTSDPLITSVDC